MKRFFLNGFFLIAIGCLAFGSPASAQAPNGETKNASSGAKKSFVLLELYTSEGCPTCPPADANLVRLEKEQPVAEAEIVTLALHVDYWNSPVWKDAYSSPLFSRRQQLYSQAFKKNSNYTPQMVVDGRAEFVGNNLAKARQAIGDAAKMNKAKIEITPDADKYKIKIFDVPAHENATVFLAITEDDLASNRKGGLKSNAKPENMSVVRELKSIGMLAAEQSGLEFETVLQLQPVWKKDDLKLIVFVQENASRKVFGVGKLSLSEEKYR